MSTRTAVFTGTFDPLTLGHLDVVRRGSALFDGLIVAVGVNPSKAMLFDVGERVELARVVVAPYKNVRVEAFDGLAVQFVRKVGARVILRGVRSLTDMEYEFSMTLTNARLAPEVETVFLMADGEYSHVSSSLIKQIAQYGGEADLERFVPAELIGPIMAKMRALGESRLRSRDELVHDLPRHVGQPEIAPLEAVGQASMVEAEQLQDRRVEIIRVDRLVDDIPA